jgi:hypothetical protein
LVTQLSIWFGEVAWAATVPEVTARKAIEAIVGVIFMSEGLRESLL